MTTPVLELPNPVTGQLWSSSNPWVVWPLLVLLSPAWVPCAAVAVLVTFIVGVVWMVGQLAVDWVRSGTLAPPT